jgi:hypothetical protein
MFKNIVIIFSITVNFGFLIGKIINDEKISSMERELVELRKIEREHGIIREKIERKAKLIMV